MPVITIRVMGGADTLKTEGLVLKSMRMGHIRVGYQLELPIICMVWVKGSEMLCIVGPRLHKATKVKGFRGKAWKDIEQVSGNDIGELRNNSRGRWGCIPGLRGRIGIGRIRGKSRGMVRT
jgi:hypothetical protein